MPYKFISETQEDRNNNGVPDYLERTVTTTYENPDGSKTVDRMKLAPPAQQAQPVQQAREAFQEVSGATAAPAPSTRERFLAETRYGAQRWGSMQQRERDATSAVDKLLGIGTGERQRRMFDASEQFMGKTLPAALQAQGQIGASEATARGMENQGLGAAQTAAAEKRFQTLTEAGTAAADLAQRVKEYNARSEVKPFMVNGQQVGLVVNGQFVDLREKTPEGFYVAKDQAGKPIGAMTKDGVLLKQNDRGELVVDRPSQVVTDALGNVVGVSGGARPLPANPLGRLPAAGIVNPRTGSASGGDTGDNTVVIEAPDGTRQRVPKARSSYYVQKGGKIVG